MQPLGGVGLEVTYSAEDNVRVFLLAVRMFLKLRGSEVRECGVGNRGGREIHRGLQTLGGVDDCRPLNQQRTMLGCF